MSFFMLPSLTDISPSNVMCSFMLEQQANSMALQSMLFAKMFNSSLFNMPMMSMPNYSYLDTSSYSPYYAPSSNYGWDQFFKSPSWTQNSERSDSADDVDNPDKVSQAEREKDAVEIKHDDTEEEINNKKQLKATCDFVEQLIESNSLNEKEKTSLEYALDHYTEQETVADMNAYLTEVIGKISEDAIKDIIASPDSDIIKIGDKDIGVYLREIGIFDSNISENSDLASAVSNTKVHLKNLKNVDELGSGSSLIGIINTQKKVGSDILNVISIWNTGRVSNGEGGLIETLYNKYQSSELDKPKEFWENAIVPYIEALESKANEICKYSSRKNDIKNAKNALSTCKEEGSVDLVNQFNKLYILLRLAAAEIAENKLKDAYNCLNNNNIYTEMTKDDLNSEGFNAESIKVTQTHSVSKNSKQTKNYKDVVTNAIKNSSDINNNNHTDLKSITTYEIKVSQNVKFNENGPICIILKEMKNKAIEKGLQEKIAESRYKLALDYLAKAIQASYDYSGKKDGQDVQFTYKAAKEHNANVKCSYIESNESDKLQKEARKHVSGKKSDGISVCFGTKNENGIRTAAIAINWAEIYYRFFGTLDNTVRC